MRISLHKYFNIKKHRDSVLSTMKSHHEIRNFKSSKKPNARNLELFITLSLGIILSACWNPFAPELMEFTGEDSRVLLTEQLSPDEVLENMRYAYIYRDSLIYSQLFDSSFTFVYYDPAVGGTGADDTWGIDTELRTTGRLFRAYDHFSLVWNATIFQYPPKDSALGDEASMTKTFQLSMGNDIQLSGNAIFDFVKHRDEKWVISRWRDESQY